MSTTETTQRPWPLKRWTFPHRFCLTLSAIALVAAAINYGLQPDFLAASYLIPAWVWLPLGLFFAALGLTRRLKWTVAAVVGLWLLFAAMFVEELWSVGRTLVPAGDRTPGKSQQPLRVVSLNCWTGVIEVAGEVIPFEPDIVLFQESPNREAVGQVGHELFGSEAVILWSPDTSIVARGRLRPIIADRASHFVLAELTLPTGEGLYVASVRLSPPSFRVDFWFPSFWSDHRDVRVNHREQIANLLGEVGRLPASATLIVGGDLNSAANDAALAPLEHRLVDTFQIAGSGWGNTAPNSHPLWRVDQIWVGGPVEVQQVVARETLRSDHRMVVCDLLLQDEKAED